MMSELTTLESPCKMDQELDSVWDHAQELNQPQNYQQSDKTSHMLLSHPQLMDTTSIKQVAGDLIIYCQNPYK